MSDTPMPTSSEPAIPVVAPVPLRSLMELLTTAERDWPQATQPGAGVAFKVDHQGVSVVGTLTVHDVDAKVLATRTYDGHWELSGLIRWTPRQ